MIGTKIGQWRVLQLLGEGGMGRVVLAEHVLMKTRHAIKILHDQLSKNDTIVQRFINEARATAAIGHRNVIEITHIDQLEGGGSWYLVMKYLEGQTLTSFLASRRAPVEQHLIVHIAGEALNGLQAAHDRQIIHRDLKPDNVYLTAVKGDPYRTILLDFGVAQLGHDAGLVTRTGAVIGTPLYMAPEQHRGASIDHRTDLWAMGVIVYEMATGRLPYQDDHEDRRFLTGPEIFHRMMTRPVVDPRYYNPAITEGFARATLMALELDPARRLASARTLARMLADATPGDGYQPSGLELLKTHADELLEVDENTETSQLPVPRITTSSETGVLGQLQAMQFPPAPVEPPATPLPHPPAHALATQLPPSPGQPLAPQLPYPPGQPLAPQLPYPPAQPRATQGPHAPETNHPIGYGSGPQHRIAAQLAMPAPPMSTLGASASQSLPGARSARPRRSWLAVGISVAAAAVIILIVAVRHARTTHQGDVMVPPGDTTNASAPAPVHVQMPAPTPVSTTVPDDADATATPVAGASTPPIPPVTTNTASTADAGPLDAPAVAAQPQDAKPPDVSRVPASTTVAVDAGLIDAPALAAHRQGAAMPDAAAKAARTEPAATGTLKVVILPWAEVWVDGKAFGQTPVRTKLPAGSHRVRLKNDAKEKTVTVTVTSAKTTVIDETW